MLMGIDTVEAIADDLLARHSHQDLYEILGSYEEIAFARWVRNAYGLWENSPLTEEWRESPDKRDIRDGIDCSEGHPDNVSGRVLKLLLEKLRM